MIPVGIGPVFFLEPPMPLTSGESGQAAKRGGKISSTADSSDGLDNLGQSDCTTGRYENGPLANAPPLQSFWTRPFVVVRDLGMLSPQPCKQEQGNVMSSYQGTQCYLPLR